MAPIDFTYAVIPGKNPLAIHHLGPPLSAGPLPTLLYFALSGEESLQLDPYHQPALYAAEKGWRVLSFTLPGHGPGYQNTEAMRVWAEEVAKGRDFLTPFLDQVLQNTQFLIETGVLDPKHLAVAGLSRGAFIAFHLAARHPSLTTILGFAPLLELNQLKEFQSVLEDPLLQTWDLQQQLPALVDKRVRFSMGNRDLRVGTRACFEFGQKLVEANFKAGHRSPPIEWALTPSIGAQGHGTSPASFRAGIDWIIETH